MITGGMGYVGGRLSAFFSGIDGYSVTALSRKSIDFPLPANLEVRHPNDVDQLTPDIVIHLAALNEHECVAYPQKAIEFNIGGTLGWLEWSREKGVKKFIYFSTAHVYAKPLVGFIDEHSKPLPIHPYAITHKAAEDYTLAWANEYQIDTTIVRLSNSFGAPAYPTADRWTLLVNDLCQMAVNERKMILHSDGMQQRDFICLSDVCTAVENILNKPTSAEIYNLGLGRSSTVWDMALEIQSTAEEVLGFRPELQRKTPNEHLSPLELEYNSDKLKSLGWQPLNPIRTEIADTLAFFKG